MKTEDDFMGGMTWREIFAGIINPIINFDLIRMRRLHEFLRLMTPQEKRIYNNLWDRFKEVGLDRAMGLDYLVFDETSSRTAHVSLRRFKGKEDRKGDWDIYYKLPKDSETSVFIKTILSNITVILTNPPDFTHYACIPAKDLRWWQSTSKGNKNRIRAVYANGRNIVPDLSLAKPIQGEPGLFEPIPSLGQALRKVLS